jgi:hypothetical protein
VRYGKLVRLVSRVDLVRAFADRVAAPSSGMADDDAILDRVLAELAKLSWWPTSSTTVTVSNGACI